MYVYCEPWPGSTCGLALSSAILLPLPFSSLRSPQTPPERLFNLTGHQCFATITTMCVNLTPALLLSLHQLTFPPLSFTTLPLPLQILLFHFLHPSFYPFLKKILSLPPPIPNARINNLHNGAYYEIEVLKLSSRPTGNQQKF